MCKFEVFSFEGSSVRNRRRQRANRYKQLKHTLYILFGLISLSCNAQNDSLIAKNSVYIGGGRQGLTYIKYERLLFEQNWTQTVFNVGLGGRPGDSEYGERRLIKIMPDYIQLFGYKWIFAEVGLEASFNFQGNFSYTELNGIIGLRFQNRNYNTPSFFTQLGYNPRIYRSHINDIDVPWYFGLGLNF